jgi:hypothetical protein
MHYNILFSSPILVFTAREVPVWGAKRQQLMLVVIGTRHVWYMARAGRVLHPLNTNGPYRMGHTSSI